MSKIIELFGIPQSRRGVDWPQVVNEQYCPFTDKRCYKIRKSQPEIPIGTCSVLYGKAATPIAICPQRLLERRQIFTDCLHLLTCHEPGNELHLVSEVPVPGGSVDYFLVSARSGKVRDFVGIELQTLDTTGTVWPERQRLLREVGIGTVDTADGEADKAFGMNWKMTAKTILVQLHHKIETFEHVGRKLVLIVQDCLLEYMRSEFSFTHMNPNAVQGDAFHLHAYRMESQTGKSYRLVLDNRLSTDAAGIAACLGLQAEANVELEHLIAVLQAKISARTLLTLI